MSITFGVASPAGTTAGAGRTGNGSLSIPLPSGWSAGQLAILIVYNDQGTASTPSNWNSLAGNPFGAGTEKLYVFWKFLQTGDGDPSTTIAGSGTNISHVGGIMTFNGVDLSNPVEVTGTPSNGTGTPMTAGAITTLTPLAWAIGFCGRGDNEDASGQTFGGSATGVTERLDSGTNSGNDSQVSAYTKEITSAGSTGAGSATTSITDPWVSLIIAIRNAVTALVVGSLTIADAVTINLDDLSVSVSDTVNVSDVTTQEHEFEFSVFDSLNISDIPTVEVEEQSDLTVDIFDNLQVQGVITSEQTICIPQLIEEASPFWTGDSVSFPIYFIPPVSGHYDPSETFYYTKEQVHSGVHALKFTDDNGINAGLFANTTVTRRDEYFTRIYIFIPTPSEALQPNAWGTVFYSNKSHNVGFETDGSGNIIRWFACMNFESKSYGEGASSIAVEFDKWIRLDFHTVSDGTSSSGIELWVDGQLAVSKLDYTTADNNHNSHYFGINAGNFLLGSSPTTFTVYLDSIKDDGASIIGEFQHNAITDNLQVSDVCIVEIEEVGDLTIDVSSNLTLQEDVTIQLEGDLSVLVSDVLNVSENLTSELTGDLEASVADNLNVSEDVTTETAEVFQVSSSEQMNTIDVVFIQLEGDFDASASSSLAIADAVDILLTGDIETDIPDLLNVTDAVSVVLEGDLILSVVDQIAVSDVPIISQEGIINPVSIESKLTIQDAVTAQLEGDLEVSVADVLNLFEQTDGSSEFEIVVADQIAVAENIDALSEGDFSIEVSDEIGISESVVWEAVFDFFDVLVFDEIRISESLSAEVAYDTFEINVADDIFIKDYPATPTPEERIFHVLEEFRTYEIELEGAVPLTPVFVTTGFTGFITADDLVFVTADDELFLPADTQSFISSRIIEVKKEERIFHA